MKKIDVPVKFPIPFAANAGAPYISDIPTSSQIGVNPGRASLNDGFVPVNMQPIDAGGIPPFGQDQNGILFRSTSWDRWFSAGGPLYYDSDFAIEANGYPADAVVRSRIVPGNLWMSTVDDNTSDPDAFGANWVSPPNVWGTGDIRGNIFPDDVPVGWVRARNGYTIGASGSLASFASPTTVFLYVKTWLKFSNSICPVTGGRGANPLADFNALKPIQVYDMAGAGMIGNEFTSGRLAGVPPIFGNVGTTGSMVGENFHANTLAENGPHDHNGTTTTETMNHTHTGGGSTTGMNQNNPHTHNYDQPSFSGFTARNDGGVGQFVAIANQIVTYTNIDHGHAYSFTTSIQGNGHQHLYNTSVSGSGQPHNNVFRCAITDWLQKL